MDYKTFEPHPDLQSLVKFYWTLEVPFDPKNQRQLVVPDGCIEMTFNLKDPIKRYTSETDFQLQPCGMVMGQRTQSFYIEPAGDVDSFAVCFYPYGFASFTNTSLKSLVDVETPLETIFGRQASSILISDIREAENTSERINILEKFLFERLNESLSIDNIVKTLIDPMMVAKGQPSVKALLKSDLSKRRKLERLFRKKIGISPKQLGRALRLHATLERLLNKDSGKSLTDIAYENDYYDQAHFIKDFKEFTGIRPKEFLSNESMALVTLFYK